MSERDHARSESVVISRRSLDTALLAPFFVLTLAVSGVVIFLFAKDLRENPSVLQVLVLGLGAPVLLGGTLYVAVYWSRVASNAEFGDAIRLRTMFRRCRYSWTQLGRLELREQSPPVPSRFVVKLLFTDGSRFDVFANRQQAEALFEMAERALWARDWPGAPLPTGTGWAFVGLGVVAVALGVWIICDPVADVVRNVAANNWAGIEENVVGLVLGAVVVPLTGLAGIGVGAYHLIRRPIVIRPGLFWLRPGEAPAQQDQP
jgi:hypothetical protein